MNNPKTPEEWQEAVNAAAAARAVADCKLYGVIDGGPRINVARCDQILEQGRKRGIMPSRPITELAIELINAINGEANGN
jgi:hypothetical protein